MQLPIVLDRGSRVPLQRQILGDQTGMHMLVRFRNVEREPDPARDGVRLTSAAKYYFSNAPTDEYVMGFNAITERVLREGVSRLQRAWSPHAKGARRG